MRNRQILLKWAYIVLSIVLIDLFVPQIFIFFFHPFMFNYDPLTTLLFSWFDINDRTLEWVVAVAESIFFVLVVLYLLARRIRSSEPRLVFKIEIPIIVLVYLIFRMACPVLFMMMTMEMSWLDVVIIVLMPVVVVLIWMSIVAHILIRMRGRSLL